MGKTGESFCFFHGSHSAPTGVNSSDRFSAQLREVLDGADHLAGIAVLVRRRLRAARERQFQQYQGFFVGFIVLFC